MIHFFSHFFFIDRDASKILRKALIGSEGKESAWRYCVTDTNSVMGFALGAMFVDSVFKGEVIWDVL